ncbi:MAG: hypothetical protein ACOYXC_06440, partial [Candidatus Rifleibacteriota bacterium]
MFKRIIFLSFLLSISWVPIRAELAEDFQKQNLAAFSPYYKTIGAWTGQIILPPAPRRLPGGSVPFMVFSSPVKGLVGRIIKLSWNREIVEENWFDQMSVDVNFNKKAKAFGEKAGCRFPSILEGWKKVSPFESLAANRSENTIEVLLRNAVYRDSELFVAEEPVQINGSLMCLARFAGKAEGNLRKIVHFNPETRKFDGPREIVMIMPRKAFPGEDAPNTSLDKIEESGLNAGGFYLYGKRLRNCFLVKSVEPRLPLLLKPTTCISQPDEILEYAKRQVFDGLRPGLFRSTFCADD